MAVTPADSSSSTSTKKSTKKKTTAKKKTSAKKAAPKAPPVNAKVRAAAHDYVLENVTSGADLPVENAAALIPFFEQLYRHQRGEVPGPLRILHYGDSHTAADEWTGDMRMLFQERFGDGGSGFSLVPGVGYRRLDVRSGSTRAWHADGLVGHAPGDGVCRLGSVILTVCGRANRSTCRRMKRWDFAELFYYQRPGGGAVQLGDSSVPVEQIDDRWRTRSGLTITWRRPWSGIGSEVETPRHQSRTACSEWVAENPTSARPTDAGDQWRAGFDRAGLE